MPPSRAAKDPARRPGSITSSFGLCCRGAALPEARRTVAGRVRRIASAFPGSGAAPRPYGDSRRAAPAACHARSGGMRSPIRTHRAARSSGANRSPRFGALENQGLRRSSVKRRPGSGRPCTVLGDGHAAERRAWARHISRKEARANRVGSRPDLLAAMRAVLPAQGQSLSAMRTPAAPESVYGPRQYDNKTDGGKIGGGPDLIVAVQQGDAHKRPVQEEHRDCAKPQTPKCFLHRSASRNVQFYMQITDIIPARGSTVPAVLRAATSPCMTGMP